MEISLFLGVLIGLILGLTGAGGGVLAVPALVAGTGFFPLKNRPVTWMSWAPTSRWPLFPDWFCWFLSCCRAEK